MSGTAILAMTLISAAATIAIGGYDVLNDPPAPAADPASGRPVLDAPAASPAPVLDAPTAVTVSPVVKDKPADADDAFRKWIHDAIASPMPSYDPFKNTVKYFPYATSLVRHVTHKWTMDAEDVKEHEKLVAAVVLLARRHVDVLARGLPNLDRTDRTDRTDHADRTGRAGRADWQKAIWGNRNAIALLSFYDDTGVDACVIDVAGRVARFVTWNGLEGFRAAVVAELQECKAQATAAWNDLYKGAHHCKDPVPAFEEDHFVLASSGGGWGGWGRQGRAPGRGQGWGRGQGRGQGRVQGRGQGRGPGWIQGRGRGSIPGQSQPAAPAPKARVEPYVRQFLPDVVNDPAKLSVACSKAEKQLQAYYDQADARKQGSSDEQARLAQMADDALARAPSDAKDALATFLPHCVRTFLPPVQTRAELLTVVAALLGGAGGSSGPDVPVPDFLDRLAVAPHEAATAWAAAMEGLRDHGKNTGAYDAPVRPAESERPKNTSAKCPDAWAAGMTQQKFYAAVKRAADQGVTCDGRWPTR